MADKKDGHRNSIMAYAVLYAYKFICIILKALDVRLVAIIGRIVGYAIWALMPGRRRIVARNLRIVTDPTLRADKLRPMVRRNIVRTTMNLACSLKTGLMKEREAARSIRMEGADVFEANGSNGQTVVSCIPHAGNWEILARIRPYFGRVEHFGSMYRRLANPLLEDFVYKTRTRYGCEMYSKENGIREVLKVARKGGLLGVLSDQFTREGVYVPYFGKVTGVTPLPALIYKRCKGKGHLFSVFTRNTGLGRWDAVLGREIHLPEHCDSVTAITMQVNLALEKCQRENILDGFWMHHRWKTTAVIAPEMDDDAIRAIETYGRLPFRIIVCAPESREEMEQMESTVSKLGSFRPDAQVTIVCPEAHAAYWRAHEGVTHVVTSDGARSLSAQFDDDAIYKDGPFDIAFIFNYKKSIYRRLKPLFPLYVTGWADHPMAHRFNTRYARTSTSPFPSAEEFAHAIYKSHQIGDGELLKSARNDN